MILLRLQEAFHFWRNNLFVLLLICIPFSILASASEWFLGPSLTIGPQQQLAGLNVPAAIVTLVLHVLVNGAFIGQLASLQSGNRRSLGECLLFSLMVFAPLMLCELLVSLAVSLGLMLLVLPGLWVFARLSLASFAVVLERQDVLSAIRMSMVRTESMQWVVLGSWLSLMMLSLIVTGMTASVAQGLLGEHGIVRLPVNLVGLLMQALVLTLLFRFYVLARTAETA